MNRDEALRQTHSSDPRKAAEAWFNLAGLNVDGASDKAVESWEALFRKHPDDPLVEAFLGGSYVMKARDAYFIPFRIKYVRTGLNHLDAAVSRRPDDYAVRLVRASATCNLPDIFDYRKHVISDLQWLLAGVGRRSGAPSPGSEAHGRLLALLAKMYLLRGEKERAMPLLERLERDFSSSNALVRISRRLRKHASR